MPIKVNCAACGKGLKAADGAAGKRVKCPGCGESIRVPGDSAKSAVASDEFDLGDVSSFDESQGGEPLPPKSRATRKSKPKRQRRELTGGDVQLLVTFRRVAVWLGGFCVLFGFIGLTAFGSPAIAEKQFADPVAAAQFQRFGLIWSSTVLVLGVASCLKQGWGLILLTLLATLITFGAILQQRFPHAGFFAVLAAIGWIGSVPAILLYLRWIPTTTKP